MIERGVSSFASSASAPGIYRGKVESNLDPLQQGRLQVSVVGVPGASSSSWARPCAPFAASGKGGFVLPPSGANVWVMFEAGNPQDPVWMGGFWDAQSLPPASPAVEEMKVFQSDALTVTLTDGPGPGMLEIKLSSGAKIAMGPSGVEIDNGQGGSIVLEGPKVSVNNGALEVV